MSQSTGPFIDSIYRYPVKGLSPQALDQADLEPGKTIAFDRAYAIENGSKKFDPANPVHMPKINFLVLMRNERLASLETRFDDKDEKLTILREGKKVTSGHLNEISGRQILEQFFAAFMSSELRGAPRIVHAPGHSISDVREKCLSIINLASVRDLARIMGKPVNPLRFRANLYIDGVAPWAEMDWVDQEITIGGKVVLKAFKRTKRCAAVNVDPQSAKRDMNIPQSLNAAFGHMDTGIYATVQSGGVIKAGDPLVTS